MSNDTIKATLPQDLYSKKQKNHKLMRRSSVSQVILDTQLKKVVHTKYEVLSNMGKKQPKICKDRISEKDLP